MTSAGAAPSRGARVVRHRLTWLAYLGLGLYGFFLYGFGPTTPLVREELGISRTLGGLYGTALAVGAVIAGFAGTAPVRRVGRRTLLWGSAAGLSAGVVLYTLGGSFPVSLLGALVCGTAGSWIVTVANASLMDEQGPAGPAALSEGNAVAAGIGTVAPLVVGGAVALGLGWRAGLLVVVLVAAAVYLAFRSVPIPDGVPVNPADHPDGA
ncbi:MAG: MFS transporter, partial [Actinomycetia bacterium]|nr:MFS transporter [Actinomycetes bacterium]